jgi:glycosyltransferase involved in cell wall biosynthesis
VELVKVVQVAAYYPPHLGGVEYCCHNISTQLAARGHEVTVLTSTVGAGPARTERTPNLVVRFLRGVEFAHTPIIPGLAGALLRVDRTAVVHVHLSHVFSELVVFAVAKLRRLTYVAHFHMDVDASGRLGPAFLLYKATLLPFVVRRAAAVITLSGEQRDLVVERYRARPQDVVVIPNGVGEEYFADRNARPGTGPARLLFVGRFALQKNIPRLLRALPLMRNPVRLQVVGNGEREAEVQGLVRELGLEQTVDLLGRKDAEALRTLYRAADVFVMPSDREGMPLVLLEAMASGLPVVGSNVQGLREFLDGRGVLVDDPSPETFAAALDALVEDPDRMQRLSVLGREFVQRYTWAELVGDIEAVYASVAGRVAREVGRGGR